MSKLQPNRKPTTPESEARKKVKVGGTSRWHLGKGVTTNLNSGSTGQRVSADSPAETTLQPVFRVGEIMALPHYIKHGVWVLPGGKEIRRGDEKIEYINLWTRSWTVNI